MKKLFMALLVAIFGTMTLMACSSDKLSVADKEALLAQHKFSLASANGTPFVSMQDRSQFIQFDKDMQLTGQICNMFSGSASLKGDLLQVPALTTTNMLCSEEVNALEEAFFAILQQGAVVTVEAETLTLSSQASGSSGGSGKKSSGKVEEGDANASQEGFTFVLHRENSIAE